MAVDGAVGHHAVIVIQMVKQLFTGKHFPRLVGERFQQAELRRGEIQQFAAPACLEAAFVNDQRAFGVQHLKLALRLTAAQDRFHARDHLPRAVWLADVIVGADFKPQQTVDLFDFGRYHHNGHIGETTNFTAQAQAVGTRQHQIQQDQIRRRLAHVGQHLVAVADKRWRIARGAQIVDQQLPQFRLVFHDQNARCVVVNR